MPIFDQGYQHWSGHLSGQAWRSLAIARHGVRVGLSGRILRFFLMIAWLPAIVLVVLLCLWGMVERQSATVQSFAPMFGFLFGGGILLDPHNYRVEVWTLCYSYFLSIESFLSMVLLVLVGPDLISQDLRYNALPLYFSRSLRRIDYFLGKLGVIVAFIGMVMILPSILAYLFGLIFSLDYTIVRDTYHILLASVAFGILFALSAGLLMLALSSLSRNSRYVSLFWLGLWIVSGAVSTVLGIADQEQRDHQVIADVGGWQAVRASRETRQEFEDKLVKLTQQSAKTDWRPLVSYRANMTRIADELLKKNATVEKFSGIQLPTERREFVVKNMAYQYPWQWSAAVLGALAVASVCVLSSSVKSLDRLK